jgi:20S proteasome alpha/beta subunit
MTIALGFACQEGIIVVSDSQMSSGDKFKRYDEPKVFHIPFRISLVPATPAEDEDEAPPVLPHGITVAISGSLDGANYFRDILERRIRAAEIKNNSDIASAMEASARETREKIVAVVPPNTASKEERDDQLGALNFSAIVAFFLSNRPFIYTISLWHCLAVKSPRDFETIGCGGDIASFVLTEAHLPRMKFANALALAIFAVEMCKKFDQACGGKVQHRAILRETGYYPTSFSEESIEKYSNAANSAHSSMIRSLVEKMNEIVKRDEPKRNEEPQ